VENTLVDSDSTRVDVENALIDLEKQLNERSFLQVLEEQERAIKMRNERLKAQTYAQYLKLTPTNQTRLMLAFDIKEGKLQMSFIKPTTQ